VMGKERGRRKVLFPMNFSFLLLYRDRDEGNSTGHQFELLIIDAASRRPSHWIY